MTAALPTWRAYLPTWRAQILLSGTRLSTWHAFTADGMAAPRPVSMCGQNYAEVGKSLGSVLPEGDECCFYCAGLYQKLTGKAPPIPWREHGRI